MRPRSIILLVLALGCGLVASIGISQVLQRPDSGPVGETAPVWVAMTDIKRDDLLNMQNIKLEQWPKDKIPPGALSKLEDVDGKRARVPLCQGEVVLDKKLLAKGEQSPSTQLPKGYGAFTVTGDAINSHGGLLHPGDRVDVLVYVNSSAGNVRTGTKTILRGIQVFAINDQVRSSDDKTGADSIAAKTVTLLVTPTQAEKLALAAEIGKIRLFLRSPDIDTQASGPGASLTDLFATTEKADREKEAVEPAFDPKASGLAALLGQKPQPAPQPTPQPVPPQDETFRMQIIRGTEISQAEFSHKLADPDHWDANGVSVVPGTQAADSAAAVTAPAGASGTSGTATKDTATDPGTDGAKKDSTGQKDNSNTNKPRQKNTDDEPEPKKQADGSSEPSHS